MRSTFTAAAVVLATACGTPAPESASPPAPSGTGYVKVLQAMDAALARVEPALEPDSHGGKHAAAATLRLQRARLSGSYDDYHAAAALLNTAIARAPRNALCAEEASIAYALHRIAQAADAVQHCLQRFGLSSGQRAELMGLSGDLLRHQGRFADALPVYRAALDVEETIANLTRLAFWHHHAGHYAEAVALLDRADARYRAPDPHPRAWLRLMRGIVAFERGRWDEARAHYYRAAQAMPGWWLVEEHRAELLALQGHGAEAMALYREIVAGTGHPEFMDALAELVQESGDETEAADWVRRAREVHEARLALLPESALGHALEHFLAFAPPAEALVRARQQHAARPAPDATLQLARALLATGRHAEAQQRLQPLLESGFRLPELFVLLTLAAEGMDDPESAKLMRAQALSLNPKAFLMYP